LQKARRAAISEKKRNETNRKHRETRRPKKAQAMKPESSTGEIAKKMSLLLVLHHISNTVMEQFVRGQATNKQRK
jgi:hypothetical protein